MDEYIYDNECFADTFICRHCGELCSEDVWNDDDICNGCLGYDNDYQRLGLEPDARGYLRVNNCKNHKVKE